MNKLARNNKGFTLVELLVATVVLALVLTGLVQVFIRSSVFTDLTRSKTAAMSELVGKMDEIRNYDFDSIYSDYDGSTFTLSQLSANGKEGNGYVYVTEIVSGELLEIELVATWWDQAERSIYSRVFGEDTNKNGVFETSSPNEDVDGNGKMSSIVTLVSRVADRL